MLDVVSAVEHRDQHSPHMHILLYSEDKPITQILAKKTGQKDTGRESMKEAYSAIQHKFHSFANENIVNTNLNKMRTGRKYVSLGQFKQKGNYEYQERMNKIKELTSQNKRLNEENAQIYEKEEKNDLNSNSEQKNDSFETNQINKKRKNR